MKLLIVDDEKIIREGLLGSDWASIGVHSIQVAENGLEALQIINTFHPQVVLADVQMPGLSGVELAKELQGSATHVILLSGYSDFSYAQSAVRYGVFDYLLKPSSPAEILNVVARCLEGCVPQPDIEQPIQYNANNKDMDDIMKYLYQNYMTDISLQSISDHVHLSSAYVSKLVKKETGYNFSRILSSIRMIKAAELLQKTELKVYMICQKIGIHDQRYFSQQFQKMYGKTPMEYRKDKQSSRQSGFITIVKRV